MNGVNRQDFLEGFISKTSSRHCMGWSIKLKIVLVTLVLLLTSTSIVALYLAHLQQQHPVTETLFGILFRQDFLLVFIVTLLISLVITIAFAYTLIEPVDKLIIGTQLVGQGQLDYQIRKYSNDEIGRLVEAFNEMILKLRSSIEKETKSSEKALLEQTKAALIIDSMADGVFKINQKSYSIERLLAQSASSKILNVIGAVYSYIGDQVSFPSFGEGTIVIPACPATTPAPGDQRADINQDGVVNVLDYIIFFENFGKRFF